MKHQSGSRIAAAALCLMAAVAAPLALAGGERPLAPETFGGRDGRIVFAGENGLVSVRPDGGGLRVLTPAVPV